MISKCHARKMESVRFMESDRISTADSCAKIQLPNVHFVNKATYKVHLVALFLVSGMNYFFFVLTVKFMNSIVIYVLS